MLLRLILLGLIGVVAAAALFVSDLKSVYVEKKVNLSWLDGLCGHHLGFPCGPLARRAAFVTIVDFLFDFVAELGVGVFLFRRHGGRRSRYSSGQLYISKSE